MKRVLCPKCNKPIHIKEFAGVTKEGFWHEKCLLEAHRETMSHKQQFTPSNQAKWKEKNEN